MHEITSCRARASLTQTAGRVLYGTSVLVTLAVLLSFALWREWALRYDTAYPARLIFENNFFEDDYGQRLGVITPGQIPDDAAIDAAIDTAMNSPELEAASAPQMPSSNVAVHLASYRSRQAAESGWNQLQTKFSSQLGGLNSVVRSVNLGGQRGTFFRLVAGPIQTQARAQEICQQLKRADQYCDTLTLDS